MSALDRLRAAVVLTKDAVKAVSITAMEALREGANFIRVVLSPEPAFRNSC